MKRLIVVAGHGRCGSSMVMQMLAAAGLRCAGTAPDYEHEALLPHGDFPREGGYLPDDPGPTAEFFRGFDAAKILLPHRVNLTKAAPLEAAVVWLDRNLREQSRSQLKMIRRRDPSILPPGHAEAKLLSVCEMVLARERVAAIESLKPAPRLEIAFEHILSSPLDAATAIAEFVGNHAGRTLNARRMASVVIPRSPECQPGFAIESLHERGAEALH